MKRCPICARSYDTAQKFCSVHGLPLVEEIAISSRAAGELTGVVLDNRYRLGGVAGRGGMGVVYEAENLRIGRRCAVKVLHSELLADPKMRMRLFREVQATSKIRHPNIVEILDFGDDEAAGSYLVMEFLDGHSLGEVIRKNGPASLRFFFKVAVQLAAGLTATHTNGLIHRDLKPSNVRLLPSGLCKVLDFGLVKAYEPGAAKDFVTITTGGIAFGTPWYMSPEQASFQVLDQRTDIYSLGIIFYEMLVGRPPFLGDNPLELIDAHRSRPVPLPSKLDPPVALPVPVEMLVLRCLAKDPQARYQSMADVADALRAVAEQAGISAAELQVAAPLEARRGPEAAPEVEEEWTLPVPLPELPLANLHTSLLERLDELAARVAPQLRAMIPRYRALDTQLLEANVRVSLRSAIRVFDETLAGDLPEELRQLADERSGQSFSPTEILGALWVELSAVRQMVREVAAQEIARNHELEERLDQRVLSFVFKLMDYYLTRYHQRLTGVNKTLSEQNDELQRLRTVLNERVDQASRQVVESEQLKVRVVENISSGIILVDHEGQVVRIFNKAAERISGIPAAEAIGRTVDEVVRFIEGVPLEEFREQLRDHGEVGLRKMWLRLPTGVERATWVRGQMIRDTRGEHAATLMIIDDVTEREHIIESFSRYLSRDVVDQVLQRGKALQPRGEKRSAVLLAANIREFRRLVKESAPEAVVELLSDYVRAVSEAVFHHGGMIETIVADSIIVFFDNVHGNCGPAVKAAVELLRRLEGVNQQREARQLPPIRVGVGIHAGDVLVANVGGKRRMAQTVVGEASAVALALQEVASGGEILVSAEVARCAGEGVTLEPGPVVQVKGQSAPVEAHRVSFDPSPLFETVG